MKSWLRNLLIFVLPFSALSAATTDRTSEGYQFEALKAWIATKRQVTIKERGGSLSLSGDVRSEYTTSNEQLNGLKNVGSHSLHPNVGSDQFRIVFGLLLDYRADATWASVKLKFSNNMGVITGSNNRLNLERAFLGVRIVDAEKFTIDFEPGRRKISYTFDSYIQFNATMDGLLIKYDQSSDRMGDFYIHAAAFIINDVRNQFGYIMETGILNVYNTGVYVKYSFIDWHTKHFDNPKINALFEYFNNQVILGYRFVMPWADKVTVLYSAFLINSAAPRLAITNYKKANKAAYLGGSIGEVRKKGDWSFNTNVQYVQPLSIPEYDFGGIGLGSTDFGLYEKTNYIGWVGEFAYLITDNLTIAQGFKYTKSLDFLPNRYTYKQYRIEFIYAW